MTLSFRRGSAVALMVCSMGGAEAAASKSPAARSLTDVHARPAPLLSPPFTWPTPDLITATEIPGTTWSRGVPVALKAVLLKKTRHELLQIYADAFEQAGFYMPPDKEQLQGMGMGMMLTALDTKRKISYTVMLQDNGNGTTTVVFGEANLGLMRDPKDDPNDFPLFPGSAKPLRTHSEVGEVVSYDAKGSPEQVLGFYQKVLTADGYHQPDATKQPGLFMGKGNEISIGVLPAKEGSQVVATLRSRPEGDLSSSP